VSRGVAVVTGAGRGIGRATALAFAGRGLDVALLGRTKESLELVAEACSARGVSAQSFVCDVARSASVTDAATRVVTRMGAPAVVVNNAGIVKRGLVHETSEEDFRAVLDANLVGAFLVTRAFLPTMLAARTGRVVMVSSISATLGTARQASYCASKWGLHGFMKSLAEELRGTGLITLAVVPGSVDTDMLVGSGFPAKMSAEDVAASIVYAGLDAPVAMNGSALEMFG